MAIGIAMKNWSQVGATPSSTFDVSVSTSKTRKKPIPTSRAWVAKSTTARSTFRLAASLTPTMLIPTRRTTTIAPTTMSHGFSRSGSQNTDR